MPIIVNGKPHTVAASDDTPLPYGFATAQVSLARAPPPAPARGPQLQAA
jgi:hypothetical protein